MADTVLLVVEGDYKNPQELKNVAKDLNNISGQSQKTKFSFTELNSVLQVGMQIFNSVKGVVNELYGSYAKIATATRDLAIASGTTAEEASTLLQVMDDFEVTAEDVQVAARALKEKGLSPTLETLAQLSDQFLAIEDPAKQLEFAQDNLGRSYKAYLNVLKQGGSVLRENANQVNKNLILTDEQIEQFEQERLAIDEVSDSYEGLKVKAGAAFGTLIIRQKEAAEILEYYNIVIGENADQVGASGRINKEYQDGLAQTRAEYERNAQMGEIWGNVLGDTSDIIEGEAIPAVEDLTNANKDYLNLIGTLSSEYQEQTNNINTINAERAKVEGEMQRDLALGWWEGSEKIQGYKDKLAELDAKEAEYTADFELNSAKRKLAMLEEGLSVDGLTEAEMQFVEQSGLAWGVYTEEAVADAQAVRAEVQSLIDAFNNVPSEKHISIVTNYVNQGVPTTVAEQIAPRQSGGPVSAGELFRVNETRTEYFRPNMNGSIIPLVPGGGAGGINVSVEYNSMMSLGNASEIKKNLIPLIIQGVEEAQAQGRIR